MTGMPNPPAAVSSLRNDFFWLDMVQSEDLRDIGEFARLGDNHFRQRREERIAATPRKVRNVAALFAPSHEMHVHWAVVILLCVRMEETVKAVSTLLHEKDVLPRSIEDFKHGSLIERFRLFLVKSARWSIGVPKDETWDDVFGVCAIRNCLIHNRASFADYASTNKKRADEIQTFSKRKGKPAILDGWLDIDLQTSLLCVTTIQGFFDELFETIKERPDYLGPDRIC